MWTSLKIDSPTLKVLQPIINFALFMTAAMTYQTDHKRFLFFYSSFFVLLFSPDFFYHFLLKFSDKIDCLDKNCHTVIYFW